MKKQFSFMIMFLLIGILIGGGFITYKYSLEKQFLLDETSNNLIEISEEKVKKINNYLEKMEKDIGTLQESKEVKELLKKDLVFYDFLIKNDVDQKARIVTKEVENFIRAHPEMSLEDLQKSSEFQEIVVQPIGKDGYSGITEAETFIILFHKFPEFVGFDMKTEPETYGALLDILNKLEEGLDISEGFYDWRELDGKIRKKYVRFTKIPVKPSDGVGLSIGVSAYVDDYKIIENTSQESDNYLKNFKENSGYQNLVLISPEGFVVYGVEQSRNFGTNLEWSFNLNEGLSRNYFNTKEMEDNSFFGPYVGAYGDINPKISIMAPVYNSGILLGYVGLIDEMNKIFDIMEEINDFSETRETYLVNDERLLISPLRNKNLDMLVQSVDTENAVHCLSMKTIEHRTHGPTEELLNYRGDLVLGSHFPILNLHWCLLTEIDKIESIDIPARAGITGKILISLLIVSIFTLIGFFIGRFIDKRNKFKRRKR